MERRDRRCGADCRFARSALADPTRSPRWAFRSGAQMRTWGPCALGRENLGAPWGPHVVANAGHAANQLSQLRRQGPG